MKQSTIFYRQKRQWTEQDDEVLRTHAAQGMQVSAIADDMRRGKKTVQRRAKELGIQIKSTGGANERRLSTREERNARTAARAVEAEKAMQEHDLRQDAIRENQARLRAARLARDAD